MPDKLPSEIIRITLDDATYKGTGVPLPQLTSIISLATMEREKQPYDFAKTSQERAKQRCGEIP